MPEYFFKNPETEEIISVIQKMNDVHEYIENGIKFERLFTIPQASIDTNIDPRSARDFVEKTGRKKGTIGDLWNTSAECAEKRGEPDKKYDVWSKSRKNKIHPEKAQKDLKKDLNALGFDYS